MIELNLMESPWAYSVMAVTILIDAYLLYIFFTVRSKAITNRVRAADTLAIRGVSAAPHDNDIFGPLNTLIGYIVAIAAIVMLAYAVSPAIHGYMAAQN